MSETDALKRALHRERKARKEAERLLEQKALELYNANQELAKVNKNLETEIQTQTHNYFQTALRLRTLISSLHAGILVEDQDRKIAVINQKLCDMFRIPVTPNSLLGSDCSQSAEQTKSLFQDPDIFLREIREILDAKEPRIGDILATVDERTLIRDYIPIFLEEEYLGHLWHYRDITEDVQRQSEIKQLAKFPQENPNAVIRFLPDGSKLFSNEPGNEFCGLMLEPQSQEQQKRLLKLIRECHESRGKSRFEMKASDRFFDIHLSSIPEAGYVNGYMIDITEIKRIAEELEEARKIAEDSAQAKEGFLANMSHEIRTPMNAIIGMASLLRNTPLTARQQHYLHAIQHSGQNLLAIINDILDFSKIISGNMPLELQAFDLEKFTTDLIDSIAIQAQTKDIDLFRDFDTKLPPYLICDPFRLNQILLNLVGNAIKFTHTGNVRISVEHVEDRSDASLVRFSVKDTGIGIPEDKQDLIFESFQQQDVSISREYGGTGLGLSISKQLVEILGGNLQLESELGKGTEFWFELWMEKGEEQRDHIVTIRDGIPGLLTQKRVLLVEDNGYNRELASTFLEEWGMEVDCAGNGVEAVEMIQLKEYEIVLMDIQMPVMGGIEATEIIRRDLEMKIPILALTANVMQGDEKKYLDSGMDGYIAKPFDPADLYLKLSQNIASSHEKFTVVENAEKSISPKAKLFSTEKLFLMGSGSQEFVKRMLKAFVAETPHTLKKMEKSVLQKDPEHFKAILHQIEPMANMMSIEIILNEINEFSGAEMSNSELKWHSQATRIMNTLNSILEDIQNNFEKLSLPDD